MTGFQVSKKKPVPCRIEDLDFRLQVRDGDRLVTEVRTNVLRGLIAYLEAIERSGGREV